MEKIKTFKLHNLLNLMQNYNKLYEAVLQDAVEEKKTRTEHLLQQLHVIPHF
jgi:hypothetical protein